MRIFRGSKSLCEVERVIVEKAIGVQHIDYRGEFIPDVDSAAR
jgi:hypothetical protein